MHYMLWKVAQEVKALSYGSVSHLPTPVARKLLGLIFLHTFHPKPQELLLVSLDLSPLKRKGRDKYRLRSKVNSVLESFGQMSNLLLETLQVVGSLANCLLLSFSLYLSSNWLMTFPLHRWFIQL